MALRQFGSSLSHWSRTFQPPTNHSRKLVKTSSRARKGTRPPNPNLWEIVHPTALFFALSRLLLVVLPLVPSIQGQRASRKWKVGRKTCSTAFLADEKLFVADCNWHRFKLSKSDEPKVYTWQQIAKAEPDFLGCPAPAPDLHGTVVRCYCIWQKPALLNVQRADLH